MLKMVAKGKKNGKNITCLIFGLSYKNLEELKKGHAIKINGEEIHAPGFDFLIFCGETEQSMGRELSELVGPNTKVNIDPRLTDA